MTWHVVFKKEHYVIMWSKKIFNLSSTLNGGDRNWCDWNIYLFIYFYTYESRSEVSDPLRPAALTYAFIHMAPSGLCWSLFAPKTSGSHSAKFEEKSMPQSQNHNCIMKGRFSPPPPVTKSSSLIERGTPHACLRLLTCFTLWHFFHQLPHLTSLFSLLTPFAISISLVLTATSLCLLRSYPSCLCSYSLPSFHTST